MTRTRAPVPDTNRSKVTGGGGGNTAMRVIVPLKGVVQGRGGLLLGSVIPCALFYFLQLYLRQHHSNPNPPNPNLPTPSPESESEHAGQPVELPVLPRSVSRTLLAPRCAGGPVYVLGRANSVLKGGQSPYDVGLRKVAEDPYDELSNPNGVIQLDLDENKLSLDLVGDWFLENAKEAILGGGELGICGIACYQPLDGLMELKVTLSTKYARRCILEAFGACFGLGMDSKCMGQVDGRI